MEGWSLTIIRLNLCPFQIVEAVNSQVSHVLEKRTACCLDVSLAIFSAWDTGWDKLPTSTRWPAGFLNNQQYIKLLHDADSLPANPIEHPEETLGNCPRSDGCQAQLCWSSGRKQDIPHNHGYKGRNLVGK